MIIRKSPNWVIGNYKTYLFLDEHERHDIPIYGFSEFFSNTYVITVTILAKNSARRIYMHEYGSIMKPIEADYNNLTYAVNPLANMEVYHEFKSMLLDSITAVRSEIGMSLQYIIRHSEIVCPEELRVENQLAV